MRNSNRMCRVLLKSASILLLAASYGPTPSFGQTPQEKALAFAAIKAQWESLPGLDTASDNAELLAFLRSRPEFSDSGIVEGSSCVWAKFNDGRLLILANNFELDPPNPTAPSEIPLRLSSPAQQASSASGPGVSAATSDLVAPLATAQELPRSGKARLIHTIRNWPTAVPDIRPWLVAAGYEVIDDPGTLTSLRTVSGDGVLYMEAHAGLGVSSVRPPATRFALYTADEVDLLNEDSASNPTLFLDLSLERVVYLAGKEIIDPVTREKRVTFHYGITDDFVSRYWDFAANSFVYLTACSSDGTIAGAQDFKKAVLAVGAAVYAGWSQRVTARAALDTAKLVFDRFVGANDPNASPEANFKQRPFDWQSVGGDPLQSDLGKHNLGIDTTTGALLSFTPNSITGLGDFGQLAPSIFVEANYEAGFAIFSAGTLDITGTFGSDPRPDPDSKVTVGGMDCPVQTNGWTPNEIFCDLPPGAAGDVVVTVRKHESNKARLTKWNTTFRYRVQAEGSLQATITYGVSFRADVRKARGVIHAAPIGPFFLATGVIPDESSASYVCSGTAVQSITGGTTTITWSGSGNVPASRVVPEAPGTFLIGLNSPDPLSMPVAVEVNNGDGPGCDWVSVFVDDQGVEHRTSDHWNFSFLPHFDIGMMPVEPNDPSFPAGSRDFTGLPGCSSPQTLTGAPQCRIEWDPIPATAATVPDPNSAR